MLLRIFKESVMEIFHWLIYPYWKDRDSRSIILFWLGIVSWMVVLKLLFVSVEMSALRALIVFTVVLTTVFSLAVVLALAFHELITKAKRKEF